LTHLSKNAALDVNQLAIDVTDVKFNGNEATATVSIKPKSAPEQAMSMSYTLERQGEKWLVKGKAAGHAGGGGGMGAPMEGGAPSSSPAPVMPPRAFASPKWRGTTVVRTDSLPSEEIEL